MKSTLVGAPYDSMSDTVFEQNDMILTLNLAKKGSAKKPSTISVKKNLTFGNGQSHGLSLMRM